MILINIIEILLILSNKLLTILKNNKIFCLYLLYKLIIQVIIYSL